jgi:diguanylate cyclase
MQSQAPDASNVQLHELLAEVLAGNPATAGFDVHYQPIVRFDNHSTVAVEAVPRWQHPDSGQIEPLLFMAAADRTGLTGVLEDFVMNRACADADALTAAYGREVSLHVNISARRLGRPDLDAALSWTLGRHKLPAGRLVIEITEANDIRNLSVAAKFVQRIRERGVRVALDSFGSGTEAMGQLQALPIDLIKLDAALTGTDAESWRCQTVCRSLLDLCQRIGLSVIADGVQTVRQGVTLREMGCEMGQGKLYGTPLRLHRKQKVRSRTDETARVEKPTA